MTILSPMQYGISLWSDRVGCPRRVSPSLLPTTSLLAVVAEQEKEKVVTLCKGCSATAKTLVWYQHWFLIINLKHSTIWDTIKKVNSISARPSTERNPKNSAINLHEIQHIIARYLEAQNKNQVNYCKMLSAYETVCQIYQTWTQSTIVNTILNICSSGFDQYIYKTSKPKAFPKHTTLLVGLVSVLLKLICFPYAVLILVFTVYSQQVVISIVQ